jgi:hypothetical protein
MQQDIVRITQGIHQEGGAMRKIRIAISSIIIANLCMIGLAYARTPAPKDAVVYIIWPHDGTVIHGGKLWVRMGLRGAGVAPKGTDMPNVGHHHLIIDADLPPFDEPIPSDRNYLHFGGGQTEARLVELPPGKHTLQLLMGDKDHIPHDPPLYSNKITITVAPY